MKRLDQQVLIAMLGLALVLAPCLGMAQTIVKIGNIEPLSGPSASVGLQDKQAREMAVEEINAAGGIKSLGGAKLELIYADSESKPEKGVAETERLINSEKVNVLTGCWNSAVTYPATPVAERYGVPFVVPVSVPDTITEHGFKNVFRIAAKDSWWMRDQFRFLKDMQEETGVKLKTVAFIFENGDWGTGFAEKWRTLAKEGGYQIVLDEPYPSTASDLTPVVTKLKTANPDVVLLVSNAADAILLTNTMAEMQGEAQGHPGQRRRPCRPQIPGERGQERPVPLRRSGMGTPTSTSPAPWKPTPSSRPSTAMTSPANPWTPMPPCTSSPTPSSGPPPRPGQGSRRPGRHQAGQGPGHDRVLRFRAVRRNRPEQERRHRQSSRWPTWAASSTAVHRVAQDRPSRRLQAGLPRQLSAIASTRRGG